MGAGWLKAAFIGAQQWGKGQLVNPDGNNQQVFQHVYYYFRLFRRFFPVIKWGLCNIAAKLNLCL